MIAETDRKTEIITSAERSSDRSDWNSIALPFFTMVLIGLVVTVIAQVPMFRDGSYYFLKIWGLGQPLIAHNRLSAYLIQIPLLAVISHFDNFDLARLCFNFTYAVMAPIGLFLSWLVVRKTQPHLMVWPAVALGLTAIPSRIDYVSESNIVASLIWPAFLCLLTKPTVWSVALLIALSTFTAVLHPVAIPYLTFMSLTAAFMAFRDQGRRWVYVPLSILLLAGAIARVFYLFMYPSSYEQGLLSQSSIDSIVNCALVAPVVITGVASVSGAAFILFSKQAKSVAFFVSMFFVGLAGVAALYWSGSNQYWFQCFWYSKTMSIYFCALMLIALIDGSRTKFVQPRSHEGKKLLRHRTHVWNVLGLISAMALLLQAASWQTLSDLLRTDISSRPQEIIEVENIGFLKNTPLNHWSVTSYAIVLQGMYPHKNVLFAQEAELARRTGKFRLTPWDETYEGNHYRLPEKTAEGKLKREP